MLYGGETSTGAFYRLLARCSLLGTLCPVDRKAVAAGQVLSTEYDALMRALNNRLARKVNLVPVTACLAAAKSLGDNDRVRALLQCMREPLPRVWELRDEEAANRARHEEDLLLPELIEEAEGLDEFEAISLGAELCESFEAFAPVAEGAQPPTRTPATCISLIP